MGRRVMIVGEQEGELRLDVFLAGREPGWTRSQVQTWIARGLVSVAGAPVTKAGHRLRTRDAVAVEPPPQEPLAVVPEAIPLSIVYEDQDLLVVDKPAGMVVHPAPGNPRGTLVNALLHHCRDLSGIGGALRPGIVHRLDKDTSGLLVVAKSDPAHRGLAGQFRRHAVEKIYSVVVWGCVAEGEGTVDAPVGRHPVERKRMSTQSRRAKEARTHWRVRERFGVATLLEVRIETGRTHQIRVHSAFLGHPVVGDTVYGRPVKGLRSGAPLLSAVRRVIQRQALHAGRLSFTHPRSGEALSFSSPLPEDMAGLCALLREDFPGSPASPFS